MKYFQVEDGPNSDKGLASGIIFIQDGKFRPVILLILWSKAIEIGFVSG